MNRQHRRGWVANNLALVAVLTMSLVTDTVRAAETDTQPADDIMRPTNRGLRLTPEMARMMSKAMVDSDDVSEKMELTGEQKSRMADVMARRIMELGHRDGQHAQAFLEGLVEAMLVGQGKFTPEAARELGGRALPAMPGVRRFLDDAREDARQILTPEQLAKYDEDKRRALQSFDRFEAKMKRWAEGGANDGEDLNHYEPQDGEAPEPAKDETTDQRTQMARWQAESELTRTYATGEWAEFLEEVAYFFGFDEAQTAEGQRLLAEHRQRAQAVMTDEWKQRFRKNRRQRFLLASAKDVTIEPWVYHLDREHQEMTEPVEKLGKAFREAVLALVTDEQRAAALARVRERAARHGLAADRLDMIDKQLAELARKAAATQAGGG